MKFFSPFNLPKDWNLDSKIECSDPSLTVQADRDQADINEIVRRFGVTGQLPYGVKVPAYDDYAEIPMDYHTALNLVLDADQSFLEMPAEVRFRFNNDAGSFLDFVHNPDNYDEAVKLGIVLDTRTPPAGDDSPPAGGGE